MQLNLKGRLMTTGVLETLQAALQQVLEFETSGPREGRGVPQHRVNPFRLGNSGIACADPAQAQIRHSNPMSSV